MATQKQLVNFGCVANYQKAQKATIGTYPLPPTTIIGRRYLLWYD